MKVRPVPAQGRAGLLALVAAAAAASVLWPSLESLHEIWQQIHDYRHGYLIAAVAAGWFGLTVRGLWRAPARPSLAGSALLGAALLLWLIALNANSLMLHQLLVPVIVWAAVLAAAGWRAARRALLPVAFLYFAIPIWEHALPVLQRMSVLATETLLALLGVPAEVREYKVTIPEGTFRIVEGCSGKRYFMVTLAIAVLAASVNHLRQWRFLAFVAVCGVLALVANWVRIVIVIYAGHVTDMQHYLVAVEHVTFGNAVFAVLLLIVFLLARLASRGAQPADATAASASGSAGQLPDGSVTWCTTVPLALLLATLGLAHVRANATPAAVDLGSLPLATGTWQGPLPPQPAWQPAYREPDAERRAAYTSEAGAVEVYANGYAEQRQGRELVSHGNTLLAPGAWERVWPPTITRIAPPPFGLAAFEARSADGSLWLIAYTFKIGSWITSSGVLAQLAYGAQSLLGPAPAGVIALAVRCEKNCEAARALAAAFWDDMSGPLLAIVADGSGLR